MRDLATIQRRFYALVTAGEGVIDPGLLGTSRRLDVYAGMYIARLHDVLAADHPKLRVALGDDAFRALATDYARARPPTSFTVRDAGCALGAYVATRADLPPWSADLAALERARVEVFDAADAHARSREDLAAVPIEQFPDLVLALVPAAILATVRWTVDDLWSAIEDDATWTAPTPCERMILVWRRDLRVLHRTLDRDEALLLHEAVRGATLADLSALLADDDATPPSHRLAELLARWVDAEILVHRA